MNKGDAKTSSPKFQTRWKNMYSKKLRAGELGLKMGITRSAATVVAVADSQKKEEELKDGFWEQQRKQAKAFSEKQRKFLEEKFVVGETTGKKLDPVTVARQMKRKFSQEEVFVFHANSKFRFTAGKMQKLRSRISFRQRLWSSWKQWRSAANLRNGGVGVHTA